MVIYKLYFTSDNKELHNNTGARRDDPSYTATQPTVALKEYVGILSCYFQVHKPVF